MTDATAAPLRGADMGRVLRTFRCWPGPVASLVMTGITVGVVIWQWISVPDDSLWWRVFTALLMLLLCSAIALPGILERHRVCEHGLVLGFGPTRTARYVVPWSSVDPGRVRMLRRAPLLGRHPALPTSSPHYRIGTGPLAHRALAVNGLDSATEAPSWLPIPGLLETTNQAAPGAKKRRTSYAWWVLGTPRPAALAEAIEAAMVADGYDNARGLAARVVDSELTVPWTPRANPLPARKR